MKTINIDKYNEIVKCPKCNSANINENGINNICDHLVFIGTSETLEPEIDKDNLILGYNDKKYETIADYFKECLDDIYSLYIDSSTRQIDVYLLYKKI
tara:strand:+ start:175 stop:468 length:294 start_codon:yes stop_codon:yes gene_type:complete